jgi:hypothetical protein
MAGSVNRGNVDKAAVRLCAATNAADCARCCYWWRLYSVAAALTLPLSTCTTYNRYLVSGSKRDSDLRYFDKQTIVIWIGQANVECG